MLVAQQLGQLQDIGDLLADAAGASIEQLGQVERLERQQQRPNQPPRGNHQDRHHADRQQSQPRRQVEAKRPIEREARRRRHQHGRGDPKHAFDEQMSPQPAADPAQAARTSAVAPAATRRAPFVLQPRYSSTSHDSPQRGRHAIRERFRRIHSNVNNTMNEPNTIGASHNSLRYSSSRPTSLTLNAAGNCS